VEREGYFIYWGFGQLPRMSELFLTYEEEYKATTESLYALIAKVPTIQASERDRMVGSIKEKLLDVEDAVDGMGIACRGARVIFFFLFFFFFSFLPSCSLGGE
jgi:hypothetical protein